MNLKLKNFLIFGVFLFALFGFANDAKAVVKAFPTAEGFGASTVGGRGGRVIEVINLNDSGPGSFRAALEASGPRIVVFRVAGTIHLNSRMTIINPYITIAGQTALGDGIQINGGYLSVRGSEIIIRHLRWRTGPSTDPETSDAGEIFAGSGQVVNNVIFDHCSFSWAEDEVTSIIGGGLGVSGVTLQWNIISESLNCAGHPEGCHGKGLLIAYGVSNISVHHNLLAHHDDRNPLVEDGEIDLVNNVIYNWNTAATTFWPETGIINSNLVGNYYLPGPNTPARQPVRLLGGHSITLGHPFTFTAMFILLIVRITRIQREISLEELTARLIWLSRVRDITSHSSELQMHFRPLMMC